MPHQSPDTVEFFVDAESVADIDPLDSVGSLYEVGINGVGYMLDDTPEDERSLPVAIVPSLDTPRLATSETPLSQSIERYVLETFHDWSGGAGQKFLNREDSSPRMFFDSEGVDPFSVRGELSLLPSTSESLDSAYSGLDLVVVGTDVYALTAADGLTRFDGSSWGSEVTITDGAAIIATDMTSDGQYWYLATGTSIVRGTTTDPAASWSSEAAARVKWAAGRICAAVTESGSTPNRFTTLAEDGTEEQVGGHLTLDAGHTIVLGGVAAGVFYFGSFVGDQGQVWAWELGVDDSGNFHVPFVAWDMPQGLVPAAIEAAGGEVWIRAHRPTEDTVRIYRGVPGQGLSPFFVADLEATSKAGGFTELDDLVLFSWEDASGDAALGAVNLITGGYARWLQAGVAGDVNGVVEYDGKAMFAVAGQGVYVEDDASFVSSGWLQTSVVDGGSILDKILDVVTIDTPPLGAGESVNVDYSLDAGGSYSDAGTLSGEGAKRKEISLSLSMGSFALQVNLLGDGSSSTTAHTVQAKYHALGLRDVLTTMRVKAYDNMVGLNGADLPENGWGRGAEIMRDLEQLGQGRVLLQDVDWHITGATYVAEVIHVEARRTLIFDSTMGKNSVSGYVDLTLRRVDS